VRDQRVQTAVLETARGGILRRGLAVRRARAAIVTNVAADHFGEYGIHDLRSLAEAKLVVARAVDAGGRVVLNADDAVLCSLAEGVRAPICWFALDAANEMVRAHRARGGDACFVRDGSIVLARGALEEEIAPTSEVVMARRGTARHNIANALGGVALAAALGVPLSAIGDTLRSFGGSDSDNPGRMIELDIGDVHVVVDFAHNPHGIRALFEATAGIAAKRRLLLIGQGGDRDDAALGELALTAWSYRPDAIVLKEMEKYLRGRPHGETTRVMEAALLAAGAPREAVSVEPTEMDGVRNVLRQARPGDLLLLTVHEDYEGVMGELQGLGPGAKGLG
jgi:UDP-N-acetylmuramyl tripeptide synthase